jgi:hypothetical protein
MKDLRRAVQPEVGRAIIHKVSVWFPSAELRVQSQFSSRSIYGGRIGTAAGILRVLPFLLQSLILPMHISLLCQSDC